MEEIRNWAVSPETMGSEALTKLPEYLDKYPYCSSFRLLYCIALGNTHSTMLHNNVRQAAAVLPDLKKLFLLINNGEYDWTKLMNLLKVRKNSGSQADDFLLIDQFLDSMHLPADHQETIPSFDPDQIKPYNDDILTDDELFDGQEDDTLSLIDSFLEEEKQGTLFVPQPQKMLDEMPETEPEKIKEKAFLTESLAKLYVKQHKFEQALAIFSSLNLEYSKKNSYFADQIRYLEKVIELQKEKNNK